MNKINNIIRQLTILLLMTVGMGEAWGQNTVIADIDFSNPKTDGVVVGRVNSMAISSDPTDINSDGHLVLGKTANTVTIPEQQRDGQIVTISFDFAFGKLVNRYVNFYLKDAVGNNIAYFSYQPYNGTLDTNMGITTADLPASPSEPDWAKSVTFTITLNYSTNQITTTTTFDNTNHTPSPVSMSITNPFAAFVVGSSYDTYNNRFCQFDNLLIKSNTNNYSYSVKARVNSTYYSTIASGAAANGSSVTVPYHEFIKIDNNLYITSATNQEYRKTITLDNINGKEVFIDYTLNQENVLFFSEAEDIAGSVPINGNNADIRCSNAYGAYFPNETVICELSPGHYRIWGQVWGSEGTTFSMTANGSSVWSCTTTGSRTTNDNTFQLTEFSDIVIPIVGSNSRMLDCFYIQAIFAFKETGASFAKNETPNISSRLLGATNHTVTYTTSSTNVLTVDSDGKLTLLQTGRATVTARRDDGYEAKYLITVRSTTNALGALSYDESTHIETFTITGTGNFDVEHFEGERISFDVGNPNEVQQVNGDGLYCITDNGQILADPQNENSIPTSGTFFKFTPKAPGKLSIRGTSGEFPFNIHLVNSAGNRLEPTTKRTTANEVTTITFETQLQAEQTYYVFAESGWWAYFLQSFTFDATQSATTTINVSDLLYPTVEGGINSTGNKLDRFIPGFALTFSGGDGATSYNSNSITFYQNSSGVGQMVITPRLMGEANEGDVVFTGVTLNYSAIEAGKATSVLVNGQTADMAVGNTSTNVTLNTPAPTLTIRYGSDTDDNSFVLQSITLNYVVTGRELLEEVIDMSKTSTQLSFENSVYYVSYGQPKGQKAYFDVPSGQQAYSYGMGFNGTITYSSADPSIATVASDGTVTMLVNDVRETTINALFEAKINGEDHPYFLPSAVASYTVKNATNLTAGSYTLEHVKRGMVVEAVVSSGGTSMLSFSNTIATSQQATSSEGQLISTFAFDNGGSNAEFDVVISYVSGDNAYVQSARAYYKTPELRLNYTPQAIYNHHGNWTDSDLQTKFANNTGVVSCFDLQGIPTFTAYYENTDCSADFVAPTAASVFSKTGNIDWVTDPATTPKATIRSTGSGTAITDATVSAPISLKPTAMGYDPTAANNVATANLPVIPFPYTWDLTTGAFDVKTKALELVNITNDGNAYVLLGPGSVAVHETVIIAGREKHKTNYEIDPSRPNSRLRIPVMQGMKVSITSYGAEERVTGVQGYPLQISNVTNLRGYATATLDIKQTSNTQEYIAKDDGYVEIYNRSDVNVYIQRITVSAPYLVFADGNNPKISKTATYQNLVVNKPTEATLTFNDDDYSNAKIATRNNTTGTYTFQSSASGDIVVTATTTIEKPAKNLEPCWGQYTISLVDFYFSPNVVYLNHSVQSVSYPTNMFLSYAHLYLNGKDWLNMTAEEKSKISFSVAAPAYIDDDTTKPNFAEGIVKVNNDVNNPYTMEVRNDGQLIITAVYRENTNTVSTVKTSCKVNITLSAFNGFKYPAPTVPSNVASYTIETAGSDNPLDAVTLSNRYGYNVYYIGKNSNVENVNGILTWEWNGSIYVPTLNLNTKGSGVYYVEAVRDDGTPIASFYLTKAYPVNNTTDPYQSWDFRNGLHDSFGEAWDNKYNDQTLFERQGDWTRGMPSNRASDYRYLWNVNGNNGFIIRETAGLLVIADAPTCDNSIIDGAHCDGHFGAYSGTKGNYVYPNIGLHRSTLIIPHLPKGAYVAVAWDRTSEGDGNTMVLENLLDLEGHTIDEIRYGGSVRLIGTNAGNNQGYYTFRVAHDGNVTFTQNDKGTSRIIAIHVYYGNPNTNVNASDDVYYNRNAIEEFKGSGMTQKIMAYARANADGTADVGSGLMQLDGILTTEGETTSQWLTNYLNFSAPNGKPEFKMVNQDETLHNMTMDMSQTYFDSGNGRYAVPGLSFVGACWGKAVMSVGVRDNNGYLVAYRQYRFTVGMRPNMTYPKTWDFTRFFDNSTVKIEDSPVTVLPATVNLNTKNSLIENVSYPDNTENMEVLDTSPTSTWDFNDANSSFKLKRNSGSQTYHQYGYNDYSSYYVDDAVLVCNLGDRNNKGFVIEETRGLGFSIEPENDEDTSKKLEWAMPNRNVGYAENTYLKINGTITIAAVGDSYEGYYVFLKSDRAPDACSENLKAVNSGEYRGIVSNNEGQYIFEVNSPENMTMTFSSDTKIYGIGVTNIKKDAIHPVGGIGWATESRTIDIDYALTGYYTRHPLKVYEVKYDSYDMNTATVYLTEIKNTAKLTDSEGVDFYDHGYVTQNNGIVLKEVQTDETSPYVVPFFVPAITTTHPADISDNNMMHPNIIRKEFHESDVADNDNIFILTNVHWKYSVDSEWSKSGDDYIEDRDGTWQAYGSPTYAEAAGFYRLHIWEDPAANTMAANTAYLLVDSDDLPIALWNTSTAGSRVVKPGSIGIRWLDDVDDNKEPSGMPVIEETLTDAQDGTWYSLDGRQLQGKPHKSGIYIFQGKKVMID